MHACDGQNAAMTDQTPSSSPLPPPLVAALDGAARTAFSVSAGTPGAVVGVQTPEGRWIEPFGVADPATGTAMTSRTHLRIGSVTKTFVATILLQLVQAGDLDLATTVDRYVADVPGGDRITLALLATMRSGLANYTSDPDFAGRVMADPTAPHAPAEMIAAGLAQSPVFAPDERFEYSNTNYIILGEVLEQVTGRSLPDLVGERILGPLGMTATSWPGESPDLPEPYAQGFTLSFPGATPDQPVNATHFNPGWAGAAGALVSTVEDLLPYARALATGDGLLEPATQARRLDSLRAAPALGEPYRYGIGLIAMAGWVGHSGDIPGYRAAVYHHPEIDTSLVVLTSSDIVAGRCTGPVQAIAVPSDARCLSPTSRMFDAVSAVVGRPTISPEA